MSPPRNRDWDSGAGDIEGNVRFREGISHFRRGSRNRPLNLDRGNYCFRYLYKHSLQIAAVNISRAQPDLTASERMKSYDFEAATVVRIYGQGGTFTGF